MAIDVTAVARVVGIEPVFRDLRGASVLYVPQRIYVIGQGASASTYVSEKKQVFSSLEVGNLVGFGSPLHLACKQLFPDNGDGVGTIPVTIFPLQDDVSGAPSVGDIAPTGTATTDTAVKVKINEIESEEFVVETTDAAADISAKITQAVNAVLDMPVIAATETVPDRSEFTSKWDGTSANEIVIEVVGTVAGVTFGITQPTGGLVNPDVAPALTAIGNVWETLVLNCFESSDTTILDDISAEGEGRWGETVRKPFVSFVGNNDTTVSAATSVPDSRKTDRVNAQLVAPGSNNLPWVIAARQLARIARVAQNNPPQMYSGQVANGLVPGDDGDQWTFAQRDAAIKAGSSTIEVIDGEIEISNVVTFFHPTGEPNPAYRFVVDIVKLQQIIFNLDLVFASDEWKGAPLIPDGTPTVNPTAKNPSSAIAAISQITDGLALNAIISDPDSAKDSTTAEIDSQNPKRLNAEVTYKLSGNTNIINVTLNFGFFFGTPAAV